MISEKIFSWQKNQWELLWQSRQQNRLPHAILLSGIAGIGKKHFATSFAHAMLCLAPSDTGEICGQCRNCHMLNAKFHPDLLIIEPEEVGQAIKVDQIRELVEFVNESAQQNGYRIIIINPANAMNVNAANSLLKSLEEPTSHCLFILISNQSMRLLPTIKSRCQEIKFTKPSTEVALQWLGAQKSSIGNNAEVLLALANGAPQKALDLFDSEYLKMRQDLYQGLYALSQRKEDPLQFATRWLDSDLITVFHLLQSWLRDLLAFQLTEGESSLLNTDFRMMYEQLAQKIQISHLLNFVDKIQATYTKISGSLNLNRQLVLEELFIQWVRVS